MGRRSVMGRLAGASALATTVALLVAATSAGAAVGDLTFASCVGTFTGCSAPSNTSVWVQPYTVAVSPSGANLYFGSCTGSCGLPTAAIGHVTLDGAGDPAFSDCVSISGSGGCLANSSTPFVKGLVVSPDGMQLYAEGVDSSSGLGTLFHDVLDPAGRFTSGYETATVGGAASGGGTPALSPDGTQLYTGGCDCAAHFALSPHLSEADCLGGGGCPPTNPGNALYGAGTAVVSPDGKQLYLVGAYGLSHLTLAPSGTMTFHDCMGTLSGCTTTNPASALNHLEAIAISPDGHNLYVAGGLGITSHLTLDAAGNPTFHDCIAAGGYSGCATAPQVAAGSNLALSPDGTQLYEANGSAIVRFTFDGSGNTVFVDCIGPASGCAASGPSGWVSGGIGTNGPVAIAVSHDGRHLYATFSGYQNSMETGGIAHFTISNPGLGPAVTTGAPSNITGTGATVSGAVNPQGSPVTGITFEYGPTINYSNSTAASPATLPSGTAAVPVSATLSGLPAGTVIHYRVVAKNASGTSYGSDQTFTTLGVALPPTLAHATQSSKVWKLGNQLPHFSKKTIPVGTTFSFSLNEIAVVMLTFTQTHDGRQVKNKCVTPNRKNRHKRRCTRVATVGTLTFTGHAGRNQVFFAGRLSRRKRLRPGTYTLTIVAKAAGRSSRPSTLKFTIKP